MEETEKHAQRYFIILTMSVIRHCILFFMNIILLKASMFDNNAIITALTIQFYFLY